jgi:mitochondrial inner membrane protease subunit 1
MASFSGIRRLFQPSTSRYASHPFRIFLATLKTFFFAHLIWDHFYAYADTWGPSMLPTFEVVKDGVIVDRAYKRGRGVRVGDIVTFDSIAKPGEKVIKRVLGLQGDYVLIDTPGSGSDRMIQVSTTTYGMGSRLICVGT